MNPVLVSVLLVLILMIVGGLFVASELALLSLREGQIRALKSRGRRGAKVAELHTNPNRFLAAAQIGVTFAGFLSAAYGAETLASSAGEALVSQGMSQSWANALSLIGVTLVIAFFSLVISELVPKRLALQRSEALSLASAPTIDRIASIFRPLIWLLSIFTDLVVRALGGNPNQKGAAITEEELQGMLLTHTGLSGEERKIVSDVFTAGDTRLREVMVPRTEVNFLLADTFVAKALTDIVELPHSRYPVLGDGVDDVVGFVHVRDLLNPAHAGTRLRVEDLIREILQLPGSKNLLPAMTQMRNEGAHMAVVVDEYGGTAGIVTLEDLVEELVGDIRDEYDTSAADTQTLAGGDVEVDGLLNIDDFMRDTSMTLPDGPYETVAGFMVATLGRLPHVGDVVEEQGRRLEVSEMDGRRVARIRVAAAPVDAPVSDNNDHA